MSIPITLAGKVFKLPENGEENWGSLVDYLVALGTLAAIKTTNVTGARATAVSYTLAESDSVVGCTHSTAAITITLPQSEVGRVVTIYDRAGFAGQFPVTLSATSSINIGNPPTFLTINNAFFSVTLQFSALGWGVIERSVEKDNAFMPERVLPNFIATQNQSFLSGILKSKSGSGALVQNLQQCQARFVGSLAKLFMITLNAFPVILSAVEASPVINVVSDPDNIFKSTDSGTGIFVFKNPNSDLISFKSRLGISFRIEIMAINTQILSPTNWA